MTKKCKFESKPKSCHCQKLSWFKALKVKFSPGTCYATHAFKWILIELNRRNAVVLLVTGKFTIKLQMESILWSSFTVVSGKWELCCHGELSNSFYCEENSRAPLYSWNVCSLSSLDICYLLYYNNTRNRRVRRFRRTATGKDLNPPSNPRVLVIFLQLVLQDIFWGKAVAGQDVMMKLHYWFHELFI